MSSTSNDNAPLPDNHSNVYFLVPLTAVVVLGLLAFWIQRRRTLRKNAAAAGGRRRSHMDATGRRILERDLENAWVQGATRRSTIITTGGPGGAVVAVYSGPRQGHNNINNHGGGPAGASGRRTRTNNRWAWIQNARLPEEGLNELGEAPPPYDRRRKHEVGKDEVVVEMQTAPQTEDRCAGPSTDGGSREPPPPTPAGHQEEEAPAYEEAPGRTESAAGGEAVSPSAIIPPAAPPPGYEAAGEAETTITRPSPAYVAVAASRR